MSCYRTGQRGQSATADVTRSRWQDTASQKPEGFLTFGVALTGHNTADYGRSSAAERAFLALPRLLPGTASQ